MTETGSFNGLRPRSGWYVLPNLGRWLFILITFVYLLAVTFALFEALKLQSLVKSLAGDDETRARAAMLALHQHERWSAVSEDEVGQQVSAEDSLKFAAMTVALDKLNAATRSLGFFEGGFQLPTGGAQDVGQQQIGAGDDGASAAAEDFQQSVNQLGIALSDLRRTVKATNGVSVAESLARIDGIALELRRYTFETAALGEPASPLISSAATGAEAAQQLQVRFDELVEALAAMKGSIVAEAPAETVYMRLEELQHTAEIFGGLATTTRVDYRGEVAFNGFPARSDEPGSDACVRTAKGDAKENSCHLPLVLQAGDSWVYPIPPGAFQHPDMRSLSYAAFLMDEGQERPLPSWLAFNPELRTFCGQPAAGQGGRYTIRVVARALGAEGHGEFDLTVKDQEANGTAAQGGLVPAASEAPTVATAVATPAVAGCGDEQYRRRLSDLSARVIALEKELIEKDPDIGLAKQLSEQIVAIEDAADWLDRLQPSGDFRYRGSDGDADGSAAANLYDQQRQVLANTAETLVSILGDYSPALAVGLALDDDPEAQYKAAVIWQDFQALERFEPILLPLRGLEALGLPHTIASFGLRPQGLATLGNEMLILILVLAIGAIGSLIYMTKRQLGGALQGASWKDKPDVGFAWYLFRPIFGMVVAFAIYLMYKAGQIALGGDGTEAFAGINVPILSVIALFAGLLSWQVLDMIEGRGHRWLGTVERRELWATGLDNALRGTNHSLQECADQVGRTVGQVERWIGCRDKITPEIQDRLATWLSRSRDELFGDERPEGAIDARPMWASGLQRALTSKGRALDARALAEILGEDPDRVERWLKRELQVSPAMQWRIVEVLGLRHSELFELGDREMDRWAVGLRRALQGSGLNGADDLARRIGASTARVRAWMELQELVPFVMQGEIARVLGRGERELFVDSKPDKSRLLWATRLRDRLRARGLLAAALAKSLDVEVDQVHAWLDLDLERGRVAPATQERIAKELDEPADQIFGAMRDADAFRWGVGLKDALDAWGKGDAELARQIDADPERLRRWVDLKEPLAPAVQRALTAVLPAVRNKPLFDDKKP
jgi:plasmid maintenance system antidote protein VapI